MFSDKNRYKLIDSSRLDPSRIKAHLSKYVRVTGPTATLDFSELPETSTILIDCAMTETKIKAPKGSLVVFSSTSDITNCEIDVWDALVEGSLESMQFTVRNDIKFTAGATAMGECRRAGEMRASPLANIGSMQFPALRASDEIAQP